MGSKIAYYPAVCLTLVLLFRLVPALAGEDDYILVDRMPELRGEKQRSLSVEDEERSLKLLQEVYSEQFGHAWMQISVLSASCLDDLTATSPTPHIMAIKYLPKKPASFAIATLHDIYKEVYVDAKEGRIRLYEDVSGGAMVELSEKYLPQCVRI
jgi:hypothetical protein